MKWKIKGSGAPPMVTPGSGGGKVKGSDSFNDPDGQMGGPSNTRVGGYPASTPAPQAKRRARFPVPKSYRKYGSNNGANPRRP